ncbi:MAG: tRNA lysidine(34) synthetase TilS, partial [Candidatus Zapsychrus exili]|nr:tRNA lysidine(34) synthetase TilS [Candidatus Zapsychrus exili]
QYKYGIKLHVAHFNHNLRKTSARDQKFVENFAKKLNLKFSSKTWNNAQSIKKGSVEEKAREKRFDFFIKLAKKSKANSVMLAHNENDLAETVLMRILRGAGLQGLSGILSKRTIGGCTFIRPLLNVKRKEIESYIKKNKLSNIEDPTNKQKKFFRNKIRHDLLPLLKNKYNKNIEDVLLGICENSSADYLYIEDKARKVLNKISSFKINTKNKAIRIDLKSLIKQPPAIKKMVLRLSILRIKGSMNAITLSHIKEIESLMQVRPDKSVVSLPKNISVEKSSGTLTICC